MTGATRHVAGRHAGLVTLKAGWWLLGQPAVLTGIVAGGLAGFAHLPADLCLGAALLAGGAVAAVTLQRRHLSVAARLRRAMVDVGLVYRKDYRTTVEPRLRGRVLREGRNQVLRWELPTGVTLRRVRDHLEELEQRCDAGLSVRLERGRLHMEVSRHALPERVDFAAFYAAPWAGGELPVGLGRSRSGWLWVDLAALPHLLIGGASGQGKSVFLRQVLTWLCLRFQPSQVRLLLLDFKGGIALSRFGRLPHALRPVVSDVLAAPEALLEVQAEMQRRQALMEAANVEDIDDWHEAGHERLPRVVVVVDELAQLSMGALGGKENDEARAAQKRAMGLLCELGRLGRGLGVHLILGTQRPDADAIPGQLKAVCSGTVAFRVRNISNSHILLDCDRAVLLPQHPGRAIWAHDGREEFQGIFLDNAESLRLLEERWLQDGDLGEEDGVSAGVSRWTPVPPPGPLARGFAVVSSAGLAAMDSLATLRAGLAHLAPRRGAGGEPPAVGSGDGAADHQVVELDHDAADDPTPAGTPLPAPERSRPALRVEAWHYDDLVEEELLGQAMGRSEGGADGDDVELVAAAAADDPFEDECPEHVTRALQNTREASDVEGAWA